MLPSSRDIKSIEKGNKIREQRRELSEKRVNRIIGRTKNPPPVSPDLIATVHEELTLKQMQKYFGFREKKEATNLFWKNQRRFLEFVDINNFHRGFEKANPGYKYSHAWFLHKNPEYASKLEDMSPRELQRYREKNWEIYNNLCIRMHEIIPRYNSLDAILIPIT